VRLHAALPALAALAAAGLMARWSRLHRRLAFSPAASRSAAGGRGSWKTTM